MADDQPFTAPAELAPYLVPRGQLGDCPELCWQFRHFDWCPHQRPEQEEEDDDGV